MFQILYEPLALPNLDTAFSSNANSDDADWYCSDYPFDGCYRRNERMAIADAKYGTVLHSSRLWDCLRINKRNGDTLSPTATIDLGQSFSSHAIRHNRCRWLSSGIF